MAASGGIFAPIGVRLLRHAFRKTSNIIKARIDKLTRPLEAAAQPVLVRNAPRHPIHPAARIRQGQGRWYTTHSTINAAVRRYLSSGISYSAKYTRTAFPKSATATAVAKLTTKAPFASTLRPNLTGGALPRSAGGYGLGSGRVGGARYFSHTPAAPAQVVQNVSQAVRAFCLSGQKVQFDGVTSAGEKRFRSVTALQQQTTRKFDSVVRFAPGSYIDFHVNPTVTALTPLDGTFPHGPTTKQSVPTLNTEGFLDILSVDFSRALRDLAATINDLKRLSSLGDLTVSLEDKSTLRVRFPGCDAGTVERLCDEIGVQRGIIYQDQDFEDSVQVQMALRFPYAPTTEHGLSSPGGSVRSQIGHDFEDVQEDVFLAPWFDSYESVADVSEGESAYFSKPSEYHNTSEYEGLEGIYRFLEECDNARRI